MDLQTKLKHHEEDIAKEKKYGVYKPKGGTDRGVLNTISTERLKELREKLNRAVEIYSRKLDNEIESNNIKDKTYKDRQIKNLKMNGGKKIFKYIYNESKYVYILTFIMTVN